MAMNKVKNRTKNKTASKKKVVVKKKRIVKKKSTPLEALVNEAIGIRRGILSEAHKRAARISAAIKVLQEEIS